jgi:hypothetical protein
MEAGCDRRGAERAHPVGHVGPTNINDAVRVRLAFFALGRASIWRQAGGPAQVNTQKKNNTVVFYRWWRNHPRLLTSLQSI